PEYGRLRSGFRKSRSEHASTRFADHGCASWRPRIRSAASWSAPSTTGAAAAGGARREANLARSLVGRDERKEGKLLDQLKAGAQEALENLRALAKGIFPPLPAGDGLVAALTTQP